MRCSISSRAGQVIAQGRLMLDKDENGDLRLNFQTDGGRVIPGGTIGPDGDLTPASQELFRQFRSTWRMIDCTLTAKSDG
ncbi:MULTISPECIES: hypothetical protein [Trichocoleus]|uniref:Uncharacterized protein n=1 Tax=Trichocoleus desertorum GB2-A4 TaxID=2933944 RepID=A0ABV0J516_9CYAN|nr:hypothetical protein [Trichocoleus sp. FACHB-46]MBD1863704.1 hypothetical protein [Trichocoleus sp. FACHB-46]